jgi:secondary thiamine-phosphate synthase enzyme
MVIYLIEIETHKRREIIDITSNVESALRESGIDSGICHVFTMHTTTAISVNEAEPGLLQDVLKAASSIVPEGAGYVHDRGDGNAHAHIQAMLLGNSAAIPVENGRRPWAPGRGFIPGAGWPKAKKGPGQGDLRLTWTPDVRST